MGLEARCVVRRDGKDWIGKVHCGDGEISSTGEPGFRWKWSELDHLAVADGWLLLMRKGEALQIQIGEQAGAWEKAIRNPKSRLDKLGLKPGQSYQAWGEFDELFANELVERAGESAEAPLDIVFVRMDAEEDLDRLLEARQAIKPNGMIWAIWPKGRKELREGHIRDFALAHGLVDVKVASFSATLSALKLVIPVALR